ncbi:putative FMN-dependent luciferase-like monooxygenase, KPN_01858 family [Devosia sp. YR412]|uniref:putative FMN-dependent luciferase-like monooxygenase n=1 Tax=Devosia sp. YR412 TaxID=1881030 RepID=UPI0008C4FD56|nr:putative FMN-dependent luciferase-like monooxygenase [Devosia sp. YR412]SEQ41511.1 putative FMN-dependent luciferase-like monooxygenase, KPN_01858 family [Devosia sp. YR412]
MTDNTKRLGFFTRLLDDATPAERYRLAIEQIVKAEEQGFDAAWVAQHHFNHDEGGLPSPFVFLSHVAARTSTIRLGTGIVTLPLEAPLRVAEDAVVFDLLSGGRLELGVGSGGTASSFTAFGLDSAQRGAIHGANLAVVRAALDGADVGGGNRLYPEGKSLLGRIWQATFSVEGGQRAGAAGDGLMLSRTQPRSKDNPQASLADLQQPIIDAYLAALPAGVEPRILASRTLFVADDQATAYEWADIGLQRIADKFVASGHILSGDSLEDLIKSFDTHVGAPQDVIASLAEDATLDRATDISFQVHSVDPPHALILRSLELIATEVAPALGWRNQPNTPRFAIAR